MKMHWRHGDIMVAAVEELPVNVTVRQGPPVLAWGEVTGHSHRIEDRESATFYARPHRAEGDGYFVVTAEEARLIHEEHGPITLPRGVYRFWHQREYTPEAIRRVVD